MLRNLTRVPVRILVTGTRGKSSVTRLLQAGFAACGADAYARITGVIPREFSPRGERVIRRTSPAGVAEMRWWLSQIPAEADAVIAENSAVAPELQGFAADLLAPTLTVWTTLRADHIEAWGPGREGAARTLIRGVPPGIPVVGCSELTRSPLRELLEANGNTLHIPDAVPSGDYRQDNLALAKLACALCGINAARASSAMKALSPDLADFRVLKTGSGEREENDELATAFSANDVESTELLFAETGWTPEETTLLYHHRPDRATRLKDFLPWINKRAWKEIIFTRQTRLFPPLFSLLNSGVKWNDSICSAEAFRLWIKGRGRVFACGNVAGWPLDFLRDFSERGA